MTEKNAVCMILTIVHLECDNTDFFFQQWEILHPLQHLSKLSATRNKARKEHYKQSSHILHSYVFAGIAKKKRTRGEKGPTNNSAPQKGELGPSLRGGWSLAHINLLN